MARNWEHLKQHQFKPGQSGNPAGRPPSGGFEQDVRRILSERVPGADGEEGPTKRELLARVYVDELMKRNMRAMKLYIDREWPIDLPDLSEYVHQTVLVEVIQRLLEKITTSVEDPVLQAQLVSDLRSSIGAGREP